MHCASRKLIPNCSGLPSLIFQAARSDFRVERRWIRPLPETPSASSKRTSKSKDTELSPASIFATRDWLDLIALATSNCVIFRCNLCSRKISESLSLISIYASSSAESPRNSPALPILHPFASRRFLLLLCIVILPQSSFRPLNHRLRRRPGLFAENIQDHDSIGIDTINNAPCCIDIDDSQFMTPLANCRHRP